MPLNVEPNWSKMQITGTNN